MDRIRSKLSLFSTLSENILEISFKVLKRFEEKENKCFFLNLTIFSFFLLIRLKFRNEFEELKRHLEQQKQDSQKQLCKLFYQ